MPRLPYRTVEDAPEEAREVLQRQWERNGSIANVTRMLANSAGVLRGAGTQINYLLWRSPLDARLRELAILTVGRIARSPYEFEHHVEIALRAGVRPEQIAALDDWQASPAFDERERAVLRYSRQITERIHVDDDVAAGVQSFLNELEFMDLTAAIACYNMVVRLLEPLKVELEEGYLERRGQPG